MQDQKVPGATKSVSSNRMALVLAAPLRYLQLLTVCCEARRGELVSSKRPIANRPAGFHPAPQWHSGRQFHLLNISFFWRLFCNQIHQPCVVSARLLLAHGSLSEGQFL